VASGTKRSDSREPKGASLSEFELLQAFEFTRHYDNLLWVVTSILTTANAALLAIVGDSLSIEVGLIGIVLSVLTVFFAASFRLLRQRVNSRINAHSRGAYRWLYGGIPGWPGQWKIYVGFFALLTWLWVSLLLKNHYRFRWAWHLTGIGASAVLLGLYRAARHTSTLTYASKREERENTP